MLELQGRMMQWEIVHIPEKTPSSSLDQSLVDVLACAVEPKLANSLVRQLSRICPLENLRHVKRVRRRCVEGKIELSVIVCLSSGHDNPMEGIPDDLLQLINSNKLSLFKAKVAKYAALSKEEWEEQCKYWPTSYHPPNDIDSISTFSEEDSQLSFDYMRRAIQFTHLSCLAGKVVNASVIVDPQRKTIIATAIDETCCSSILKNTSSKDVNHNKLSATTSSPHSNANGSVNEDDSVTNLLPSFISNSYTGVSCLNPWGWNTHNPQNASSLVKCGSKFNSSWHPLRHAVMVAIEKAAARDRQLFPFSGSAEDLSNSDKSLQHFSNSFQAKRKKTQQSENEDTSVKDDHVLHNEHTSVKDEHANGFPAEEMRPYLCTGFDIYLVWEPCIMCAMALVHQRIRRVFYAFPNPTAGALGSVYRLQGERSLNHHYSVFRIMLPEKALYEVE
ncbi:putative inactive tRNA-specific adenosine deaminase-like protein 3 isoform X2 [Iris pallida]|uniref:Inactive tRNA-specific adenosine deaminase-like protein 3 isoform X2 n=1 Tax=Iris pallida TaxID=29817 RepID=A0AAX6G413_IRIPA|nr:putative inactive tRNA-specific adenosine deaminase-like protein 3 isoform X2 [Iris pallida]